MYTIPHLLDVVKKQAKDKTFNLRMADADRKRLAALGAHFGGMSGASLIRMLVKLKLDELRLAAGTTPT